MNFIQKNRAIYIWTMTKLIRDKYTSLFQEDTSSQVFTRVEQIYNINMQL